MSSGSDLVVALKLTGDAKSAVAALEETRKAQLSAFASGREAADKAYIQWRLGEAELKRLAATAKDSGGSQEVLAKATASAASATRAAKEQWVAETAALMNRRTELVANAAALDRARQAEALAAAEAERYAAATKAQAERAQQASRLSTARGNLGVTQFRDIDRQIAQVQASYNRLAASGKLSAAELAQAQLKVIERTKELQAAKNGLLGTFEKVRAGAVALAAQFYILSLAARQAMAMETAMAEVSKVADFKSPKELERFKTLLEDLTQTLPYTAQELAGMAAAGAQMGIPTDKLSEFVQLAGTMGIAFRMSAEDVGNAIAKLMNVFHLSMEQVQDLGDTINYLGNNTNATEKDILNVMTRVSGMANIFGLSARQTAALATAFLSLGRPPEIAATSIAALLQKLATVESAEAKAQEAFKRTGLSITEFSTILKTEPQQAVETFLGALERLPKSVKIDVLSGFIGREYADDIALLAEGVDKYRDALKLAASEEAKGGVGREAAKQAGTTEAAIKRMTEQVKALGDALGTPFLPAITAIANALMAMTAGVRDFVKDIGAVGGFIVIGLAVANSIGTLRVALGSLAWMAGTVSARFGVGAGLAGTLTTATANMNLMAPYLARLNVGAASLATGFYAGGKAVEWFYQRFMGGQELDDESARISRAVQVHKEFNAQIERLKSAGLTESAEKLRALKQAVLADPNADIGRTLATATDWANKMIGLHQELEGQKKKLAEASAQRQAVLAGKEVLEEEKAIEARIKAVQKLAEKKKHDMEEALRDVERYRQAASAAYERAADIQMSTADRVRELRRRDMSESAQQADIAAQAQQKLAAAAARAAEAVRLSGKGDTTGAEKAAAAAESLAKQAESLGSSLKNTGQAIGIVEKAGKIAADAAKTAGDANQKAAEGAATKAASLKEQLADLATQLDELEKKKRLIEIDANIEAAQANITAIQASLDALQDKTVTVTVVQNTVEAHSVGGLVGIAPQRFNSGGHLPGYGGGDRIHALLEAGEVVIRKEAVRYYGLGTMLNYNAMRAPLPAFAVGGLVGIPGAAAANGSSSRDVVDVNLSLPGLQEPVRVQSDRSEAERLVAALNQLSRVA
ncbi:phage tail tape measure protein [Azospira sp. APE16]|uniref:phage tail tape measure protein n=1 Tax=Azospira sp. APE16 TaxID=3394231 RepID=UPI003A4E2D70